MKKRIIIAVAFVLVLLVVAISCDSNIDAGNNMGTRMQYIHGGKFPSGKYWILRDKNTGIDYLIVRSSSGTAIARMDKPVEESK